MKVRLTARGATAAIAVFFAAKIASGLLLLKLSAAMLPVEAFSVFSQFLLLGALITTIAVGGAQNGIVRQVAAGDAAALRRSVFAAGLLWMAASLVVTVATLAFAGSISEALTGRPTFAWLTPLLTMAALLSAPGQIACAALTGLGRTRASLVAQAAGLCIGTAAAAALLFQGMAATAALAFYLGSLATGPVAWLLLLRGAAPLGRMPLVDAIAEARVLLRFSGGFVIVASTTALTLFGLRYAYLAAFDAEALGYWLVAQRISDTSTQLLGLFMIQYVVPVYAPSAPEERRPILVRSWLIGTAMMLALLLVFAAFPALWVRLLLSSAYLPAVGMILAYMAGDVLRVTASLIMHAALARSRVMLYASIDLAAIAVMGAVTLVLIARGEKLAPVIGYVTAYGAVAITIAMIALACRRRSTPV